MKKINLRFISSRAAPAPKTFENDLLGESDQLFIQKESIQKNFPQENR